MAKHYSQNLLVVLLLVTAIAILNLPSISATTSNQEVDALVETLVRKGGFTIWAKLFANSKTRPVLPRKATLFVPTDAALSHLRYATDMDPYLIPYHITPEHHLLFSDLCHLKPLSLLPTLVPSKTILITSTLSANYMVDNSLVTHPNLYLSPHISVHGINRILDLHPQRSKMPPLLRVGDVLGAANTLAAA
ncbi:FAS1 domain-containing protein [Heracleum sosnowskyi]|uniref:FAS1 domain-containing protein n=1 Tax=Heracleum sosnowskyi TaxID=360622 RepID=A0AAD8J6U4_9APIA|nr:FAS1 domain-containing protein [Heracleum sosnowskyi]